MKKIISLFKMDCEGTHMTCEYEDFEFCLRCRVPRRIYDLKIEPGISNPDYNFGECSYGHVWIKEKQPVVRRSI